MYPYPRNRLNRSIGLIYRLTAWHIPIGSMAIYHRFDLLRFKPLPVIDRNHRKRWIQSRMGGRTLYWAKN